MRISSAYGQEMLHDLIAALERLLCWAGLGVDVIELCLLLSQHRGCPFDASQHRHTLFQ
jgi:hypothetical protein